MGVLAKTADMQGKLLCLMTLTSEAQAAATCWLGCVTEGCKRKNPCKG